MKVLQKKRSARKVFRFTIFEKKYKLIKDEAADLRGALRKAEDIDYDSKIYEIEKQMIFSENEIAEQNQTCENLNRELMSLQMDKKDLKQR